MGTKFDSVWVPTLTGNFLKSYEGGLGKMWSNDITLKVDAPGEYLKVTDIGTAGAVRQFSGRRNFTSPTIYQVTQQNLPYELTLPIDIEDIRRDTLGLWPAKAAEMGGKFADHVNKLVVATIKANPTAGDNVAFFSASHPVNGTTQKNILTASEVGALDVTTAAAPTAVEMANALVGVIGYIGTLIDEAGDPINGTARAFKIVTSNPAVYASTLAAIKSQQLNSGQTNPLFAGMEAGGYSFVVALEPRLASVTSADFYVFRVDSEVKPFVWGEEHGIEMNFLGEGSTSAVLDNVYIYAAKAVRSVGIGRYQHAFKCTLS